VKKLLQVWIILKHFLNSKHSRLFVSITGQLNHFIFQWQYRKQDPFYLKVQNYEPQIFSKRMSTGLCIKLDQLKQFRSKNLPYSNLVFSATFLKMEFSVRHRKTLHLEVFVMKCKIKKFKNSPWCSVVASRNFFY